MDEIASLLKKDVDEAYRKKCEELRETKNPDEIREEYRYDTSNVTHGQESLMKYTYSL